MTTVRLGNIEENKKDFEDLNYGDVFISEYEGCRTYFMKVEFFDTDRRAGVMDLQDFTIYDDVQNYPVTELIDVEIKKI